LLIRGGRAADWVGVSQVLCSRQRLYFVDPAIELRPVAVVVFLGGAEKGVKGKKKAPLMLGR